MHRLRDEDQEWGTNPCSEVILPPSCFCNLTEIIIRPNDSVDDIIRKAKNATILGTLQSALTNFRYLRSKWKNTCEHERLLGVSLTGIMDHALFGDYTNKKLPNILQKIKKEVLITNKEWSEKIGINQSVATTLIKPSGTVSQLVNSSSGIHPRYSPYYIRRIRQDKKDPLTAFLQDQGLPWEVDIMNNENIIFSFPMKAPKGAICVSGVAAIEQLELWRVYQDSWCEHKPSCTVYVEEEEWLDVGAWVYRNFDSISGVSFLPTSGHSYRQAPYEEITEEKYEEMTGVMPKEIDWGKLKEYEKEDHTEGSQELACSGGRCDI